MIAIDSSSFIAYLEGADGEDVHRVDFALEQKQGVLPPVVLSELISDPKLRQTTQDLLLELPLLEIQPGYWERTGRLRSKLVARGLRTRLADTLIAQSCIDHDVGLITRDSNFQHYKKLGGLRLL